jgi:mono/diheme cytochrome c family protein
VRGIVFLALLAAGILALAGIAISQQQTGGQEGAQQQPTYQTMTPEQRAAATRSFLGLGPEPDKAAAARGEPFFDRNCAFCHGPHARGATGPSLITSDEVLGDDHGERLVRFLKKGRPEKGMPAFATMSDEQLKDMSEFMHLQVEEVANRGTYQVLNILVGNAAKGEAFVAAKCMSCHSAETFAHIGSKFRSPDQLQRDWVWPTHGGDAALEITATVKMGNGRTITGRVTQVSDFRITLVDDAGRSNAIDLEPRIDVKMQDPLAAHQEMMMTLTNDDMHNVTAYLATLK